MIMNYFKISILSFIIFIFTTASFAKMEVQANHVILEDYLSGLILYEKNADDRIYPASMTKIMTVIVAFDFLKNGEATLDEEISISENAWRMSKSGYSSMFIMLNDKVSVEDLLKGIIIVSGNDACIALAEGLAGSEDEFVNLMNSKAAEIKMSNSNFGNSSGINDVNNYSTVRDVALMSKYLIKNYPEYYHYFKETEFTWFRTGGDPITQGNRNPLLYKNIGADGLKTGFLTVEKYSLAASIKENERRLIAVSSGFDTKSSRSKESSKLLLWGLRKFDTVKVAKKDEPFSQLEVWLGKKEKIKVKLKEDLYITIPKRKKSSINTVIDYVGPIAAPIAKDTKLGVLNVYISGELTKTLDVFSAEQVKKLNIFSRLIRSFNYLVWGDV